MNLKQLYTRTPSLNSENKATIGFNNATLGLNATNFGINNTSYKRKRSYSKKVEVNR